MRAIRGDQASTQEPKLTFTRLAVRSFRRVFEAARTAFSVTLASQLVGAGALAAVLLCGRTIAEKMTASEPASSIDELLPSVVCLGLALFVAGLARVAESEARIVIGERLVRSVQSDIVAVASSVEFERFEQQSFNDKRDRAIQQGANQALQLVYDLIALISSVATSVSLLVVLASTVPNVLPLMVLVGAPFVVAGRASARLAFNAAYDLTPDDRLRQSLFRALTGKDEAKEIRIFDLHQPLQGRWSRLFDERITRMQGVARRRLVLNGIASASSSLLVAVLLVVVALAALDGRIEVADAAIAVVALQQMSARVRSTANAAGSLRQSALFLEDFEDFRRYQTDRRDAPVPIPLPPFSTLRVSDLHFRYPGTDRDVLVDIDLEIGRDEVVALVGTSGSGKSTLAHLIAGLYEPTSGTISWDGQDITTIDRLHYWRSLSVLHQDFVRYELTARENVALGDHPSIGDETRIREAARRASIDEVIAALPAGYDSMLSRTYDGGVELSGGEWQRVAIARAFFREAPMVILDEPASALDAVAERELFEQLQALCVGRSALLISHRFSTVRMASRIYVLHNGRLDDHGTHEELMARDGHYAAMFRLQAAGFLDAV